MASTSCHFPKYSSIASGGNEFPAPAAASANAAFNSAAGIQATAFFASPIDAIAQAVAATNRSDAAVMNLEKHTNWRVS